jgi:hypothetical protein
MSPEKAYMCSLQTENLEGIPDSKCVRAFASHVLVCGRLLLLAILRPFGRTIRGGTRPLDGLCRFSMAAPHRLLDCRRAPHSDTDRLAICLDHQSCLSVRRSRVFRRVFAATLPELDDRRACFEDRHALAIFDSGRYVGRGLAHEATHAYLHM